MVSGLRSPRLKSGRLGGLFYRIIFGLSVGFLFGQCISRPEEIVSPVTGQIHILADENLRGIIEQEKDAFESTYKYAKLIIHYDSEFNIFNAFFKDSIDVLFATRSLTGDELDYFTQHKMFPRQVHFASGALAFVVSGSSKDTAFTFEQFHSLMKDSAQGKRFVIENNQSGIALQIMQSLRTDQLPSHFFSKPSKTEVINYVLDHPEAIGVIDYTDLSDSDAPTTRAILDKVRLLGISRPQDSIQQGFVKPYQYNLQDKMYPFTRDLYYIGKTGQNDVSIGFIAFIAGDIGQKIILKAGLLPVYQTERWIELKPGLKPKIEK